MCWMRFVVLAFALLAGTASGRDAGLLHLKCPPDAKWYHGWRLILDPRARSVSDFASNPMSNITVGAWNKEAIEFSGWRDGTVFFLTVHVKPLVLAVNSRRSPTYRSTPGLELPCEVVQGFTLEEIQKPDR